MKAASAPREEVSTHSPTGTEIREGVQEKTLPDVPSKQATPIRRSTRVVKPPDRLDL